MRFLRKAQNVHPERGRYLTVSIPAELTNLFPTDWMFVQPLKNGRGLIIVPAEAKPIFDIIE